MTYAILQVHSYNAEYRCDLPDYAVLKLTPLIIERYLILIYEARKMADKISGFIGFFMRSEDVSFIAYSNNIDEFYYQNTKDKEGHTLFFDRLPDDLSFEETRYSCAYITPDSIRWEAYVDHDTIKVDTDIILKDELIQLVEEIHDTHDLDHVQV